MQNSKRIFVHDDVNTSIIIQLADPFHNISRRPRILIYLKFNFIIADQNFIQDLSNKYEAFQQMQLGNGELHCSSA